MYVSTMHVDSVSAINNYNNTDYQHYYDDNEDNDGMSRNERLWYKRCSN